MSLTPVSAIAVSEIAIWWGVGLQLGIEVKFLVTSKFLSLLGLEFIKLFLNVLDPCRQVVNASQPLFFVLPGTEGLERVAESLWPEVPVSGKKSLNHWWLLLLPRLGSQLPAHKCKLQQQACSPQRLGHQRQPFRPRQNK